ncbi:MAG: ABC transporter permease [Thermoanaerobaculaceae bacterium]
MKAQLRIAEAQLRGRPRQSVVALTSVAVGAAMLITTLSLTEGLSEDFIQKAVETSPHVEVLPRRPAALQKEAFPRAGELLQLQRHHVPEEKEVVRPISKILAEARRLPGVRLATPSVEARALLAYGTTKRAVLLTGVVPEEEAELTVLDERVTEGSWQAFVSNPDGLALGVQLARQLGAPLGAVLQALGPGGGLVTLRVEALVRTGLASVDKFLAVAHLDRAQRIAGLDSSQATKVRLQLSNLLDAEKLARLAEEQLEYVCLSWLDRAAAQIDAFKRQNLITRVLVFFTMLVAGFGVANLLVQMTAAKRRDIAILRAMGFSRGDITLIYFLQGGLLGLLGTSMGWLAGATLIRVIGRIPVDFGEAALLRNETLRMAEHPWFYLVSLLLALIVCIVAAVGPARRAASLQPTEILRGER